MHQARLAPGHPTMRSIPILFVVLLSASAQAQSVDTILIIDTIEVTDDLLDPAGDIQVPFRFHCLTPGCPPGEVNIKIHIMAPDAVAATWHGNYSFDAINPNVEETITMAVAHGEFMPAEHKVLIGVQGEAIITSAAQPLFSDVGIVNTYFEARRPFDGYIHIEHDVGTRYIIHNPSNSTVRIVGDASEPFTLRPHDQSMRILEDTRLEVSSDFDWNLPIAQVVLLDGEEIILNAGPDDSIPSQATPLPAWLLPLALALAMGRRRATGAGNSPMN